MYYTLQNSEDHPYIVESHNIKKPKSLEQTTRCQNHQQFTEQVEIHLNKQSYYNLGYKGGGGWQHLLFLKRNLIKHYVYSYIVNDPIFHIHLRKFYLGKYRFYAVQYNIPESAAQICCTPAVYQSVVYSSSRSTYLSAGVVQQVNKIYLIHNNKYKI